MVLENDQILEIISRPPDKKIVEWRKSHVLLDLYLNGGNVADELEQVKNYENKSQKELRDKIARSTKDFLSNLLNPINKVFSASGFNTELDISSEAAKKAFQEHINELPEGISIKKWVETYWKEAYITDPNGVCFIEVESEGDNPRAYPTYKSILSIHDYSLKWNKFEYIIFTLGKVTINEKEVEIFRVFDFEKDGLYYAENNQLKEYIEEGKDTSIINHNLQFIPAKLCSDIVDKKTGGKKSFINKIDEILKEYMRDSSVHSIYKFLHGFPIFWRIASKCTTCAGTGKITDPKDATKKVVCPTCSGKGMKVTSDVSDGVTLPIPKGDQPKIAPDIAGYVQPDLKTWQMQLDEMTSMEKKMHFALWGTFTNDDVKAETATARFIDEQPVQDTLTTVSEVAENVEQTLVEYMGKIMYKDLFKSATIKYGRRFLIETPDVLWDKYIKAKEAQSPISALDYLYNQFLMAEYHNDPVMLDQKMKEFYLEPFAHYSLDDLKGIATPEQMQRKLLFSDWAVYGVDFKKTTEELKKDFDEYVKNNIKIIPETNIKQIQIHNERFKTFKTDF